MPVSSLLKVNVSIDSVELNVI